MNEKNERIVRFLNGLSKMCNLSDLMVSTYPTTSLNVEIKLTDLSEASGNEKASRINESLLRIANDNGIDEGSFLDLGGQFLGKNET